MKPAADMTTDEIADDIRRRVVDNPALAAAYQPAADKLAAALRDRLPYIEPADTGAILMCVSCWLLDARRILRASGMDVKAAEIAATNIVAMAGQQLFVPPGGAS